MSRVPPTPPPIPPSSPFCRVIKSDSELIFDGQNAQEESTSLLSKYGYLEGKQYITCVIKTKSILQEGPTCGLVALLMAADALKLKHSYNLTNLLEIARAKGYTEMGEMFSATSIANLSEDLFRVKASLLNDLQTEVEDLVKHLCRGEPVLVPYDCDKNHDPIIKDGRKAHWATILGFAVATSYANDGEKSPVTFKSPPLDACEIDDICTHLNGGKNLLVFVKQGKSKFMRLWTFDQLSKSNLNLRYASHPLSSCSKDNSRSPHPPEDLSQSLAKKAVLLGLAQ